MKTDFEDAARNVEQSVSSEMHRTASDLSTSWQPPPAAEMPPNSGQHVGATPAPAVPEYRHPKKNWRLKRSATPQWYKQKNGVRAKALSGAARVARFRPPRASA